MGGDLTHAVWSEGRLRGEGGHQGLWREEGGGGRILVYVHVHVQAWQCLYSDVGVDFVSVHLLLTVQFQFNRIRQLRTL